MRRRLAILVVIAAILGVGGYFIDRSRAATESRLSGFFESQPTLVSSRLGGRVKRICVVEGDRVRAGQTLVELEDDSYAQSSAAQRMAEAVSQEQFRQTRNGSRWEDIARQQAVVNEVRAEYEKAVNGSRPEDIRAGRDRYEASRMQFEKLKAGSRPEEIASAKAAEDAALDKLRQAQRGLTVEERAEMKSRMVAAAADTALAEKNLERTQSLFAEGAISREQLDTAISARDQSAARLRDSTEANRRAELGTPAEELAEAQDAYRQAQAQYLLVKHGSRREDIEAARRQMLADYESLRLLQVGSRPEDIRSARARLGEAEAALTELMRGSRPEEIARASAAVHQAALQARSVDLTLKERIVTAPMDAQVDRVLISRGDLIQPGASIIQLTDPSDIWLRVYLPEADLPKVRVNDHAELMVDGVPGLVKARIESISTHGEFTPANLQSPDERAKQVFALRIRLAAPDSRIKAGMYATVKRVGAWQ
jgi:multidrug resistance efflux pump